MPEDPTPIYVVWAVTLVLVYLILLPLITRFLIRAAQASRRIEAYTAETLQAARGILNNVGAAAALKETGELTGSLLGELRELERVTAQLAQTVRTEAVGQAEVEGRPVFESRRDLALVRAVDDLASRLEELSQTVVGRR